jgi:hypothetical protein
MRTNLLLRRINAVLHLSFVDEYVNLSFPELNRICPSLSGAFAPELVNYRGGRTFGTLLGPTTDLPSRSIPSEIKSRRVISGAVRWQ